MNVKNENKESGFTKADLLTVIKSDNYAEKVSIFTRAFAEVVDTTILEEINYLSVQKNLGESTYNLLKGVALFLVDKQTTSNLDVQFEYYNANKDFDLNSNSQYPQKARKPAIKFSGYRNLSEELQLLFTILTFEQMVDLFYILKQ